METILQAPEHSTREESLLRFPAVIKRTGSPRSSIYKGIANGTFPKPVKIGTRAVAWPSSSIDAYIDGVISEDALGSVTDGLRL